MKKSLYGTTALVAAGVLVSGPASAQGIELGLGGYMNNFFGIGSTDEATGEPDYGPTGLFSDGEVHFRGEFTADNGLSFGAQIELESFQSDPDQIDENYGWIEGSFGRVQFGSENSAAYLMQYSAPNAGVPLNSGWVTVFAPVPAGSTASFRNASISTYLDYGNDENQITYFTPRFSGFQLGVSYAPAIANSGDGKNFPVYADKDTEYHNGFAVGLNFVESFNGFDVAIAGGYRRADEPDVGGLDTYEAYSAGANFGFAGFTLGGSWAMQDGDTNGGLQLNDEGQAWDVGIGYATGPWSFSVTYLNTEVEGLAAIADEDEMQAISGAAEYALAPGVAVSATILYGEWEPEEGNDQETIAGILGVAFSF